MKKAIKIVLVFFLVIVLVISAILLTLTLMDYKPENIETMEIKNQQEQTALGDEMFTVYSWNIGYAGLGDQEDFFMDGGNKVFAESKDVVEGYLENVVREIKDFNSDFIMLQEIDIKSKRAYKINELDVISKALNDYTYAFAKNYDVFYIPMPWPPMGGVEAGLATFSLYDMNQAERYSFDSNYTWPTKIVMLDRCFMVTRIPLENREHDLLLINAHFSAYDDGSLKESQLKAAKDFMTKAYENGDFVIFGGDWNQTFELVDTSGYPLFENGDWFNPSVISSDWLDKGWTYGVADNAPTYRLLNGPYEKGISQVGVVDGFVVSPNINIEEVTVVDFEFKDSDHNPVKLTFKLK